MSGGGSSGRGSRAARQQQRPAQYDEVPVDSSIPEETGQTLQSLKDCELAGSGDPLPPPPLPLQPPFGHDFYPSDGEEPATALDLRPVRRFIPDSWKNFFKGKREEQWDRPMSDINYISDGVECSPPPSPGHAVPLQKGQGSTQDQRSAPSSYKDPYGGSGGSYNSRKETEAMLPEDSLGSLGHHAQTVKTYSERVEEYNMRYSYMKSWAGLLRILCIVELLLGAAVFACVTTYIHKDNEWYNMYGYSQPYSYGANSMYGGYYYSGPKTPFVLVIAGLAWVVTVILLVLGMSMYYRTILLDSSWWPLTEFGINLALFILYLAAAIVYVNDANRGGLCYYPLFNTPLNASFCRIEGGQTAAIIFLFVLMIVYLISAIVSLKLWRHEGARKQREFMEQHKITSGQNSSPKLMYKVALGNDASREVSSKEFKHVQLKPELLSGPIPAGHIPKPIVMPDYIAKYPAIKTDDERERYKAVFNDQFSEYKELSAEVQAILKKFDELDAVMNKLPLRPDNQLEYDRISNVLQEYKKKKNDPTFLEKKERCEYLKNKLSHIKQRIQDYDKVMNWNDGYH
ncbi:MARVEL domain-containing protein 2-like [Rhinatrema bivittatum]|uniref:MARVEL domain-containing protein 2-like n=1 Tax=Rhinatrema bivittatum TaxID=194408 RepID=UPI00112EB517|nr:MARVEL domain-containing protein 2-like [Rhinatrema bivittatum]XP_029442572.1 MARVEL domain-containing protein 2-like [Rhinatrema bivittatum]XP_029442573.1 MARVEL domain-containing protein 2-like [Rhinatrema bivittatum]XP_029442574.1 MARVEL domain-containing protein 2-like [Rhinatrema bivittatum]XP_029442575.1 MARVEL domain-containing protein 2-like [Rhinatrema bivittatum]XP_029442576.1 MARVEL domain-containing protein 2-like [Rhinatrema bivittatum]XP_029442577.1 MARVEL domain-containing p